jgi:DNA repair protein RecO (recombination protein O)
MTESATGLILRTRLLTETSLIVQWLTPTLGRISTVAKGARRAKSPFRGKLDLFYLADFSFQRSRRSELHALREVCLRDPHVALRRDLGRLRQAAYAAAVIEQVTERETPLPAIYELLRELLGFLSQFPPQPHAVFAFELRLLTELGLQPDAATTGLTPGARRLLASLNDLAWPSIAGLRLSRAQVQELDRFLHGFLTFHFGKLPDNRTRAVEG